MNVKEMILFGDLAEILLVNLEFKNPIAVLIAETESPSFEHAEKINAFE